MINKTIVKFNEIKHKNHANLLKSFWKNNKAIIILIGIYTLISIATLINLGVYYTLESDDLSYINSGIHFKNHFELTMHGPVSAQIMPGMPWLIALVSLIFGEGYFLWLVLKILWMIFGAFSIIGVYKTVMLFGNKIGAIFASSLLLVIDFIWMNNLILTETPFMMAFIMLIYNTFLLEKNRDRKHLIRVIIWYMVALLFRGNILPYPLILISYLLIKQYDKKLLCKQMIIATICVMIFFVPWTIRNYIVFDKFIPLTYGSGNPMLLGTYQGVGYPEDDFEAYDKYIAENADEEMLACLEGDCTEEYMMGYYSLERDGMIAQYRLNEWWKNDKASLIKSFVYFKPYINIYNSFYWDEIYGISKSDIMISRQIDIILCALAGIYLLVRKKHVSIILFLGANYLFQVTMYSVGFAFDRYGQTLIFMRFIVIGIGISVLYDQLKKGN